MDEIAMDEWYCAYESERSAKEDCLQMFMSTSLLCLTPSWPCSEVQKPRSHFSVLSWHAIRMAITKVTVECKIIRPSVSAGPVRCLRSRIPQGLMTGKFVHSVQDCTFSWHTAPPFGNGNLGLVFDCTLLLRGQGLSCKWSQEKVGDRELESIGILPKPR